jgi:hypothetical protein
MQEQQTCAIAFGISSSPSPSPSPSLSPLSLAQHTPTEAIDNTHMEIQTYVPPHPTSPSTLLSTNIYIHAKNFGSPFQVRKRKERKKEERIAL